MQKKATIFLNNGFTLIELLVVISIIGIVVGLSIFGLEGARQSSRDAKRKADLESIRSALELYRADCGKYYDWNTQTSGALTSIKGFNVSGNKCLTTDVYMDSVPKDPLDPDHTYYYRSTASYGNVNYVLCASLEAGGTAVDTSYFGAGCGDPGGSGGCGSQSCNYQVHNP